MADGVLTLSAILADTTFATDELFVVMVEVCDDFSTGVAPLLKGRLGLALVVDNLGAHMRAPRREVVGECRAAAEQAMGRSTARRPLFAWSRWVGSGHPVARP